MKDLYTYKAIVDKVVDGDTLKITIDLGFTVYWKSSCRFYGVNTPELKSKDKDTKYRANEAKNYVSVCLPVGTEILIHSRELDKYGRPLVDIYFGEEFKRHLNGELIDKNYAISFMVDKK
jgi:endonuclease YncB( thermonuclease family)